jgi:uncharacterized protein (DUF427 family)
MKYDNYQEFFGDKNDRMVDIEEIYNHFKNRLKDELIAESQLDSNKAVLIDKEPEKRKRKILFCPDNCEGSGAGLARLVDMDRVYSIPLREEKRLSAKKITHCPWCGEVLGWRDE